MFVTRSIGPQHNPTAIVCKIRYIHSPSNNVGGCWSARNFWFIISCSTKMRYWNQCTLHFNTASKADLLMITPCLTISFSFSLECKIQDCKLFLLNADVQHYFVYVYPNPNTLCVFPIDTINVCSVLTHGLSFILIQRVICEDFENNENCSRWIQSAYVSFCRIWTTVDNWAAS